MPAVLRYLERRLGAEVPTQGSGTGELQAGCMLETERDGANKDSLDPRGVQKPGEG